MKVATTATISGTETIAQQARIAVQTERGGGTAEVVATLVATSVVPKELDAVVEALEKLPGVDHAAWESEVQS